MKRLIPVILVATILGLGAASVSAGHDNKGRHMDRVVEKLELTADQETQFLKIMEAKYEAMKSFYERQHAETLNQLSEVLTAEQLAKFKEMSVRKYHHKEKN